MTVKERLTSFLEYKGVNKSEFGRRIGVSSAFVTSIRKSIQPDKIGAIQREFPELNTSWLLTGEGEMLKPSVESEVNVERVGAAMSASQPNEGVVDVRFFQVSPSATFKEFCEGMSELPDSIPVICPPGEDIDDDYCVFEIMGDSMAPQIPDRARVLCREIKSSRWHQLYSGVIVMAYGDSFVIKRIVKNCLDSDNYLIITSDNPEYPGNVMVQRADIRCIFEARQVLSYPIR